MHKMCTIFCCEFKPELSSCNDFSKQNVSNMCNELIVSDIDQNVKNWLCICNTYLLIGTLMLA